MENNTPNITNFDFSLIADFFRYLNRQGPGSEEATRQALSFIGKLPNDARIADIGCGTGGQTVTLAQNTPGTITGVDLLPEMLDEFNNRMQREGLQQKVSSVQGSMDNLPFKIEKLDLIWAEGSIYNIGFEKGLNYWYRFLKPGGFIAVSETTWLSAARPSEMDYINHELPEIDNISGKLRIIEQAGYETVACFTLPESNWMDNYYSPMTAAYFEEFLKRNNYSIAARQFADGMKEEIAHYKRNKGYYSYTFFIARKRNGRTTARKSRLGRTRSIVNMLFTSILG